MSSGSFSAYAPPDVFGPWVVAVDGLGYAATVRIDVEPQGSTTLFGEVQYANEDGQQTVTPFQGTALITTCDCLQNIQVHVKGVPLGSMVDGTWQAQSLRTGPPIFSRTTGITSHWFKRRGSHAVQRMAWASPRLRERRTRHEVHRELLWVQHNVFDHKPGGRKCGLERNCIGFFFTSKW